MTKDEREEAEGKLKVSVRCKCAGLCYILCVASI
jgi:hypothetical protein